MTAMRQSTAVKLASAVALAGSTQAYGQIVPIALSNGNLTGGAPGSTPDQTEYLDVQTGVFSNTQQTDDNFIFGYHNGGYFVTSVLGISSSDKVAGSYNFIGYLYSAALTPGTTIGSDKGTTFYQGNGPASYKAYLALVNNSNNSTLSPMAANADEYLGFQFQDTADGQIHNGYIELESATYTSAGSPGGLFFIGEAYNSIPDNAADGAGDITVEAIPEPGTISSLMLGAAALGGVGLLRRRRSVLA